MSNAEWTILVIEDNPDDQALMREAAQDFSHPATLVFSETLEDGIKVCKKLLPSLVMLDLGLPDSDGFNTVGQFMASCKQTPLIVLTGNNNPELGLQAIRNGAQDFMIKGVFCAHELEARISFGIERFSLLNDPDMLISYMRRMLSKPE